MLEWIGPALRALPFGQNLYDRWKKKRARPGRQQVARALEDHLRDGQRLISTGHGLSSENWFQAVREWHARSIALLVEHQLPDHERMMYESMAPDHGEDLTTNHNERKAQLASMRNAHEARINKFRLVVGRYIEGT